MDNIIINLDDGVTLGNGNLPNLFEQTDIIAQSDAIVGPAGPAGPAGKDGKDGQAATITVGTTTTGAAGTNAQVQNSGTSSAAVLNFTIPRGERGETGATGATGATGPAGQDGQDGEAATITVGSVQTVAPEYPATVTNSGTSSAAVLDFEIPRGLTGETGPAGQAGQDGQDGADGQAATIAVGTTTTGAAGTNASVTNSGTSSAAVFNFTIPRGDTGAAGQNGTDGADGFSPTATVTQNTGSATISITDKNGTTTATVYDGVTPDTSVTSYTLSNTPAHSGGTNSYQFKKQLNIVNLTVDAIWSNSINTSWTNLGTIPSELHPASIVSTVCTFVNGNNGAIVSYGKIQIQTDGTVRYRANAAQSVLNACSFSITWII